MNSIWVFHIQKGSCGTFLTKSHLYRRKIDKVTLKQNFSHFFIMGWNFLRFSRNVVSYSHIPFRIVSDCIIFCSCISVLWINVIHSLFYVYSDEIWMQYGKKLITFIYNHKNFFHIPYRPNLPALKRVPSIFWCVLTHIRWKWTVIL